MIEEKQTTETTTQDIDVEVERVIPLEEQAKYDKILDRMITNCDKAFQKAKGILKKSILKAAEDLENSGAPLTSICHMIVQRVKQSDELSSSAAYVYEVIPAKYKNPEQRAVALAKYGAGYGKPSQHKKSLKVTKKSDIKLEDYKALTRQVTVLEKENEDLKKLQSQRQQPESQESEPESESEETFTIGLTIPLIEIAAPAEGIEKSGYARNRRKELERLTVIMKIKVNPKTKKAEIVLPVKVEDSEADGFWSLLKEFTGIDFSDNEGEVTD